MTLFALCLIALPAGIAGYAYVLYPLGLLALAHRRREAHSASSSRSEWPELTITVPVYNEEVAIAATIDRLLALDYPADRRHILVISDASTDRTDQIVTSYRERGVELLRLAARAGKTAAENAAASRLRGTIVVNTDATTRIRSDSLKHLVTAFDDPTVGVASGRDVSVGRVDDRSSSGERGYVGYEMWVRSLETRLGSIIGVSGCFYGIRRELYDPLFPEVLSRDFGCALMARLHGYRSVSVTDAVCMVPRTSSLQAEFRRKIRTMHRGLETLWHHRRLLNPFRYGRFAIMLWSHKLCRWLVPVLAPLALVGLALLALNSAPARAMLAAAVLGILVGTLGLVWRAERAPRLLAVPTYIMAATVAGILAWAATIRKTHDPVWEPTRRLV